MTDLAVGTPVRLKDGTLHRVCSLGNGRAYVRVTNYPEVTTTGRVNFGHPHYFVRGYGLDELEWGPEVTAAYIARMMGA